MAIETRRNRMKPLKPWLVLLFALGVVGKGTAQTSPFIDIFNTPFTDLSFLGAGARAHAMGGAFYAVSDDPTAISWNPAGLMQMDKHQMSASFHHTSFENKYSGNYASSSAGFSGRADQSIDQVAFVGVVIPFELKGRKFVGSASIPNSVSEIRGIDFRDSMLFTQEINGRLSMGSLGLATNLWQKLSVGLAVNIYGHGYDRNANAVYQISGPPDDTVINYRPRTKSSFSGWNFTLGGMLKMERLRLAAVFKSPGTGGSPLKERMDIRLISDLIVRGIKNPFGGAPSGILFDTNREWILPSILGLGASFQVTDDLLVAANFDIKPFSKAWYKVQTDLFNPTSSFEARDLKWNDINQFRIGGEYYLRVSRFKVPLRAGYRNVPKVYENVDNIHIVLLNDGTSIYFPGNGSQVKGNVISFGSGLAFGQVAFDLTWELASYDFEENGVMISNDFEEVRFPQSSEVSNNRVIFNFTGVF